jgi:hypothetical protein
MNAAALLSRLPGFTKTTGGWQARCPAHDDKAPSLGSSEGKDGRILLKCHAGCPAEDICRALRRERKGRQ